MAREGATNLRLIVAVCGIGLVIGAWFAMGPEWGTQDPGSKTIDVPPSDSTPSHSDVNSSSKGPGNTSDVPLELPAPDYHIAESGRLTIKAESLRGKEMLTLGLALADEARGEAPLAVRVVAVDGRVLDITAASIDGKGGGVRLTIEADWLRPGDYMIQIKTNEKTAFPLRRYVLEVQ
ncbi:MAG: hypothetical protein JRG94_17115 [Deltaproteobacteria bacterium]|nr:hypothetical protein [Deltaproteobacteria bacterium]